MPKIFISYRRADSRKDAGRIYDYLAQKFGVDNIFKDVDDIPPGYDFKELIQEVASQATVMLVIIGQQWLNITDSFGNRRLFDENDFVRLEVEAGLSQQETLVIPVLIDNAYMPSDTELPDTMKTLTYLNAIRIRDDPDFRYDIARLTDYLSEIDDSSKFSFKDTNLDSTSYSTDKNTNGCSTIHNYLNSSKLIIATLIFIRDHLKIKHKSV